MILEIQDLKAGQVTLHRSFGKKQRSWEWQKLKVLMGKSLLWQDIAHRETSSIIFKKTLTPR